jgi:DNA-binding transcriptional ArsR family regulator
MRRDIFQGIADPTRREILTLIAGKKMTPNAIAENFDSTRQAVSKHINILTECQLLHREKVGREMHYRLNPQKLNEINHWIGQFKRHLEIRFSQLDRVLSQSNSPKKEG